VLRAAAAAGHARVQGGVQLVIFPGSGGVKRRIELPEPRLGGESVAEVFRAAGGQVRESWCGPCFGQGPDALAKGESAITSFNRNWQNRMGVGGLGYLASPQVVASSALLGYIAAPGELGLTWDPERYGT
jgi:3-isopropylmalate/(R)-2-methylmalate dehydratase large subunit